MTVDEALRGVTHLFLDTAPVIYYIEQDPQRFMTVKAIFEYVDIGRLIAVTSPVTLAECLVLPYRLGRNDLQRDFSELITRGGNTLFVSISETIGQRAAELRARYNLTLTDALQVATAIDVTCGAFLTNDIQLKRVAELDILVVDELTL
jgi:predicted nucleic acid-binding protein